ncbi:M48 family metalloprotease, partial [Gammaproteobacteria bacterium]|nr:M48 family metalloprotease [Gammaproteobacteria bacterium]
MLIFTVSSCSRITYSGGIIVGGSVPQKNRAPTITTFTSETRLKEIGAEQHEDLLKTQSLYQDESLLEYVRHVGARVAESSGQPDLGYQFFILDSGDINAFASPGGYIYVTRGILGYLNSEAQLAALLGHEIGHVSARHFRRRGNKDTLGRSAATAAGYVTGIATGSNFLGSQLAEIGSIWARTASAGFGRDLELEADGLAAEYLLESGYEPEAVFDLLSMLKNYEDFSQHVMGTGGGYHGSFASHPRTDRRLQEIIAKAGKLDSNVVQIGNERFRENLDGLILGTSNVIKSTDERNRYYQDLLGYTVVFPDEWQIDETTTTVTASNPGRGTIRIEALRIQENIEPRLFIRDKLGISQLQKSEKLEQYRLLGHTGVAVSPETGNTQRIAAIYLGPRVFTFRAEITDADSIDEIDEELLASIRTFRAIQQGEIPSGTEAKIKFVQASEFFDFSVVAQSIWAQSTNDPA